MDQIAPLGPSPGAANPGNLYADLQSRTLWLGVDLAVDPSGSVLISDIVALQAADAANLITAKAYTDQQLLTRALLVHTHTSSQITDFSSAVSAVVGSLPALSFTRGMIVMYSGSLADIGVGALAAWALCDGSNGTPNLRDKFVMGAGNKVIGAVNSTATATTDDQGSHLHVIDGMTLTLAQIPSHSHGGNTGYVSNDHSHYVNLNTGDRSVGHVHSYLAPRGGSYGNDNSGNGLQTENTGGENTGHYHNVQGSTGGISNNHYHAVSADGGGGSHAHTAQNAGTHHHDITSAALREALPYYALAYIMKL